MPAVTPDRIFQAALQQLEERFTTLAFPWSPLVEKIISGKQVEQKSAAETPYIEFRVLTDGPGETHQLISGGELYPTALKDVVTKGNIYGTRLIHVYEIPGADMAKAAHPQGCEELIEEYPELALAQFRAELAEQFALGNQNNGLLSLCGQNTYAPDGTPRTGLLEANPRATQAATVLGLAKENGGAGVNGWYHQYGNITSMANNGERVFQQVHGRASRALKDMTGKVDLMIADETSYYNYLMHRRGPVLETGTPEGMKGWEDDREGAKVLGGTMYIEPYMDPAAAEVLAWNGIIYGMKSKTWKLRTWKEGPTDKQAFFHMRPMQKAQNKDAWIQEILFHGQLFTYALPCQFLVTGGHNP